MWNCWNRIAGCVLSGAIALEASAFAAPYKPASDSEVVERLPARIFSAPGADSRAALSLAATNAVAAAARANQYLAAYRAESDPRYLGYAQSALSPWWNLPAPAEDIAVARATIKQSLHDFPGALVDLDSALAANSTNAQAILLRATILQVIGKYPEARAAAAQLAPIAPRHIAIGAQASAASLNGEAQKSFDLLAAAAREPRIPAEHQVWLNTLLAEMAARRADTNAARRHFAKALLVNPADSYALAAFADFLIDQREPERAAALVASHDKLDALLLRRALARQLIPAQKAEFQKDLAELTARFDAARLRGDSIHQREEARYLLTLLAKPAEALRVAKANWAVQKEPYDTRLLLEAALAANDHNAAKEALAWMNQTQIDDATLAALAARLQ